MDIPIVPGGVSCVRGGWEAVRRWKGGKYRSCRHRKVRSIRGLGCISFLALRVLVPAPVSTIPHPMQTHAHRQNLLLLSQWRFREDTRETMYLKPYSETVCYSLDSQLFRHHGKAAMMGRVRDGAGSVVRGRIGRWSVGGARRGLWPPSEIVRAVG